MHKQDLKWFGTFLPFALDVNFGWKQEARIQEAQTQVNFTGPEYAFTKF